MLIFIGSTPMYITVLYYYEEYFDNTILIFCINLELITYLITHLFLFNLQDLSALNIISLKNIFSLFSMQVFLNSSVWQWD